MDRITVLRSATRRMSKLWKADGTIEPYDSAKWFTVEPRTVESIDDVARLLAELESDPHVCIVRGVPKDPGAERVRRLREGFDDRPLHTVLIEVDTYRPLVSDPILEPVDAALEYIAECLPAPFQGVSFAWQLSSSAGAPGKEGLFKAHLWMWLATPYDSPTLKAWAKAEALQLDHAVFQTVQPHFTSLPVFEEGRTDPVPLRSGFYRGKFSAVSLHIDVDTLNVRTRSDRQRGDGLRLDDPVADWLQDHWEVWGTLANGGMIVSCPWEDAHSGGAKGDTSSVYFPAGTNGYQEGQYVCLHNSCDGKHRSAFLDRCGYAGQRLAMLAEPEPPAAEPYVNGHALNDPLLLPPFKRDGTGGILASVANIKIAMAHPHVLDMRLRHDTFREEFMWTSAQGDTWRPFSDADYTELRLRLEDRGFKTVKRQDVRDLVLHHAMANTFDTAQAWLSGLKWDGVPRIETFWIDHFGVPDDIRGYARAVGRYTWTALAGRVAQPGVQADMAPILTGPQGVGKSRGIAAMSPVAEFATVMSFHEPELERTRKMRGTLVVELAELQGLKSRDREEILAWVTRSQEHWTPKYLEMTKTFQRRFIMFGTTNDDDFLDDPTGERRWLPLAVGRTPGFTGVDTAGIAAVRDQLWAEGAALFARSGIAWRDAERLARDEHGAYKADDAWRDAVTRWLDRADMGGDTPRGRRWLTTLDVGEGALGLPARQIKYADQRRIAKILREEGYADTVRRIDGKSTKVWSIGGEGVES